MTPRIRILAKHYTHYCVFLDKAGISPGNPDYICVDSSERLRGLMCGIIIVLPAAKDRKDWPELLVSLQHQRGRLQVIYSQED